MTTPNQTPALPIKVLFLGDSGAGKTGALASLALSGKNLRILDFDNGTEILRNLLPAEVFAKQVSVIPLQDRMAGRKVPLIGKGGQIEGYSFRAIPAKADAYQRAINFLDSWKDGTQDLGSITSWGPNDVLVVDSLTHMWKAAMRFTLSLNNHLGSNPTQPEWGICQSMVEEILALLYDSSVPCNVVFIAHVTYDKDQNEAIKGLPAGPGRALNPVIGTYFNHCIQAVEQSGKHFILTRGDGIVQLKTPAPGTVKPRYPIESGLADYFADVRKTAP